MLTPQIFFGFPLDNAFVDALHRVPLIERELLIQRDSSLYLRQTEDQGIVYLGKFLGSSADLQDLAALDSHIYSLLRKLVPDYPYEKHPLLLFSMVIEQ